MLAVQLSHFFHSELHILKVPAQLVLVKHNVLMHNIVHKSKCLNSKGLNLGFYVLSNTNDHVRTGPWCVPQGDQKQVVVRLILLVEKS